jgi:hypothetical protein
MKICSKCNETKHLTQFSIKTKDLSGYCPACKTCLNKQAKLYRANNKEAIIQRAKIYYQTDKGKATMLRASRAQLITSPEKCKARSDMNNALNSGVLIKAPCVVCGSFKSEGHHEDYTKPLDVIWLCRLHHIKLHKGDYDESEE